MQVDAVSQPETAIQVAKISAEATVQAAQIAANAAWNSALVSAAGVAVGLLGAYLAYRSGTFEPRQREKEKGKSVQVLERKLKANVKSAIDDVNETIDSI